MNRRILPVLLVLAVAAIAVIGAARGAVFDVPPATVIPAPAEPTVVGLAPSEYPEAPALEGSNGATLLSADFSTDLSAWEGVATVSDEAPSKWLLVHGKLLQNGNGSDLWTDDPAVMLSGNSSWSNYDLYTQIYPTAGSAVGVVWRASGDSYYRVSLYGKSSANSQPKAFLELVQGDTVKTLATAPVSTWPGYQLSTWMTVHVSTQGAQQKVWVNGQPVFSLIDNTLSGGRIGVYGTSDGGSAFDNVRVNAAAGGIQ